MEGMLLPGLLHDSAISVRKVFPRAERGDVTPGEWELLVRRVLHDVDDLADSRQHFLRLLRRGLEGGVARRELAGYVQLFREWISLVDDLGRAAPAHVERLASARGRLDELLANTEALLREASAPPPPVTPKLLEALKESEEAYRRGEYKDLRQLVSRTDSGQP
jgi:hypothetical protein